jgi:GTP cyclohydrolase I
MSRFVALLEKYRTTPMTPASFSDMAREMLPLLHAEQGDITAAFPYFINKSAPVSGVQSLMDYEVQWIARAGAHGVAFELVVQVPLTSLCPCSKAISEYGAHNQRSHVTVAAMIGNEVSVDEIIRLIEDEGSCELWGLLKRPDEKFVTERAYDNPKFVEDLVRDVAARLTMRTGVGRYRVEAENFESIHNHSAYAVVEGEGRGAAA